MNDLSRDDITRLAAESDAVPSPCGFQILIAVPDKDKATPGGVLMPDELLDREKTASIIGLVLRCGPDAYKDKKRFPSGPYCEIGDWVLFRSYGGQRLFVAGVEYRLISDESILAITNDPRGIKRS